MLDGAVNLPWTNFTHAHFCLNPPAAYYLVGCGCWLCYLSIGFSVAACFTRSSYCCAFSVSVWIIVSNFAILATVMVNWNNTLLLFGKCLLQYRLNFLVVTCYFLAMWSAQCIVVNFEWVILAFPVFWFSVARLELNSFWALTLFVVSCWSTL